MAKKIARLPAKSKTALKKIITVKNADGDPDTTATIVIQNKIKYTPKVSVIIPVYNVEQYLRECLDSVVNQTLREIEIICVDDGSTDSSLDILKEYAKRDNRITVIKQQNLHAGVARNAGLSVARGEYLSFLDSDDFFELNMLEETYKVAKKDNSDIVVFRYSKYDCKTKKTSSQLGANETYLQIYEPTNPTSIRTFNITNPMPWNKLFRRQFIIDNDLHFSSTPVCNDLFFVYASIAVAKTVSYCNKTLLVYRMFQKNSLSASRQKFKYVFLKAFLDLKSYLQKNNKFAVFQQCFYKNLYDSTIWTEQQQNDRVSFYKDFFQQDNAKLLDIVSMEQIKLRATRPELYISLTSYPARTPTIHHTINSLLNQTHKADKVILWLAPEQFPNREKDLPEQLLDLCDKGLTIDWYHDIKPYKKLIPAINKYPEAIIVTADDDIIYPNVWLELLYKSYLKHPEAVHCHRAYRITHNDLSVFPYEQWEKGKHIPNKGAFGIESQNSRIDFSNFYTSGSGALYPPNSLHSDVSKESIFLKLAPTEDDFWYWAMAIHNNTPICVVQDNLGLFESNQFASQEFALYNINSQNNTRNLVLANLFKNFPDIEKKIIKSSQLIISLTSYPARTPTIHHTINSLLNQTHKADKVILWLAPEQFPNREKDLPEQLLDLCDKGLTIDWYHDIRSYKKLNPTLKKYPDAIIVTADDDNIYQPTWLEKLYASYSKHPHDIHAHRVTKFYCDATGFKTIAGGHDYWPGASCLNKLVGLGGVLYPPHCFYKDILNEDLIKKLAPTNDDQWYWFMGVLNGYNVRVVEAPEIEAHYVPGTQETGLCKINDAGPKLFWRDFRALLSYYPQIYKILKTEADKKTLNRPEIIPYKTELENWYMAHRGTINLDKPKTFNEKIQWLKLFASTPDKTRLADKYLVRDWVSEKIGEEYLIPLLGVYDKFEEIDFKKLPKRFVIKCNHGCGYNIIVKDKSSMDLEDIKNKLNKWMNENFAFRVGCELHYRDITPKIIIEQYIENKKSIGGDLYDYKFWCFDGRVHYIQFLSERNTDGLKMAFYNRKWKKQKFVYSHPLDTKTIERPDNLDEMIELAEKLSAGFNHVRVDFYRMDDGTIYFGEMTFTSASGMCKWNDEKINRYFGKLIKLPKLAYNIDTGEYYKLPKIKKQKKDKKEKQQKKKLNIKPYLLFPYYLIAMVFMKYIKIPVLKFVKHTKQIWYSHSHRGKMDMLNKNFTNIMQSVTSVKNDMTNQITQIKNQQSNLEKQIADLKNVVTETRNTGKNISDTVNK